MLSPAFLRRSTAARSHERDEGIATKERPNGVLSDIAADLPSLIPTVRELEVQNEPNIRQYSFSLKFSGQLMLVLG